MRLLVVTQAVDRGDMVLGFFHRWVEMLAQRVETVEVVCLKEGEHALPENVHIHSLGKEGDRSRLAYIFNFYKYVFSLRYDAVFVHMNEEYVLLAGWWWRLRGAKVVLWRNHKMGSWRTRLAARVANVVCYTSPAAYVAHYAHAVMMPVGIDTQFFTPPAVPPVPESILFLGRIDPVKRVEMFIDALDAVGAPFKADMYGSPTEPGSQYAARITAQAQPLVLQGKLALYPGVVHAKTAGLYQSHATYTNLTPSGSFDKTIGEAMASGCIVVCANAALQGVLPDELLVEDSAHDAARGIEAALALPPRERADLSARLRAYIEKNHSLTALVDRLVRMYQ